eukprot:TRINITY_DN16255_c0_g1_i1.p1 TRINITY_DN16255_c0_g1~~TRINITY_DN16255_c0_g1_i1.p1  ORF type:complete len:439 (-),score=63.21 TRINITY_DN16255_c0_g1_i1:364-1680(-)
MARRSRPWDLDGAPQQRPRYAVQNEQHGPGPRQQTSMQEANVQNACPRRLRPWERDLLGPERRPKIESRPQVERWPRHSVVYEEPEHEDLPDPSDFANGEEEEQYLLPEDIYVTNPVKVESSEEEVEPDELTLSMKRAEQLTYKVEKQLFDLRAKVSTVLTDELRASMDEVRAYMSAEDLDAERINELVNKLESQSQKLRRKLKSMDHAAAPTKDGLCKAISKGDMSECYGKGFEMMQKMGFTGKPASSRGLPTPVHATANARGAGHKHGIGATNLAPSTSLPRKTAPKFIPSKSPAEVPSKTKKVVKIIKPSKRQFESQAEAWHDPRQGRPSNSGSTPKRIVLRKAKPTQREYELHTEAQSDNRRDWQAVNANGALRRKALRKRDRRESVYASHRRKDDQDEPSQPVRACRSPGSSGRTLFKKPLPGLKALRELWRK